METVSENNQMVEEKRSVSFCSIAGTTSFKSRKHVKNVTLCVSSKNPFVGALNS
jgi:hypothetical protein